MSAEQIRLLDAYWRAANYLTVGQIYLQDNPLLREPLRPEHIKPRLLGHWGTSPGLSLHLRAPQPADPRARRRRDLPGRARATAGRRSWPTSTSRARTPRSIPRCRRTRRACARLFRQFSTPGRHPEPRERADAGLDPRGRRARLRAGPRLRRRVRQPGPDRGRGGGRRRGGDRPARGQLERHRLPEPGARRRGAADPAPERLQDRRARRVLGRCDDDDVESAAARPRLGAAPRGGRRPAA